MVRVKSFDQKSRHPKHTDYVYETDYGSYGSVEKFAYETLWAFIMN